MTMTLRAVFSTAALLLLVTMIGCAQSDTANSDSDEPATETTAATEHEHADDHSGWWCNEHGVPEEECGLCDAKVAAEMQHNGDWCKEHDRPDSQCFICHPELEAAFAARYEAKYGKQPPKPEI
jgi:cobalt-zinc-cadmium efflux system membrane fusion protein